MHIAVDLDGKELRIDGHAAAAVPVHAAIDRMHRFITGKGSPVMFVIADGNTEIINAGCNHVVGSAEGRATGRATVGDVNELQARQPKHRDHAIWVA